MEAHLLKQKEIRISDKAKEVLSHIGNTFPWLKGI
jgi:hypothetical protein